MISKDTNNTYDIEKDLKMFYQQAEPSPEFIDTLEVKLQRAQTRDQFLSAKPKLKRSPWAFAPTFAALFVVIVVLAIGPQRVLAQVQALFGYVPGFGFVETSDFRMLVTPVSQTQDGVTVTVKQVVSNQENTYIIIRVDGLTGTSKQEFYGDLHQYILENPEEWQQLEPELWRPQVTLTLSDGSVIDEQHYNGSPWEGYFVFPVLPQDILDIAFDMARIPGILPGNWPESWHLDLKLVYVSDQQFLPTVDDFSSEPPPQIVTPVPVDVPSEPDEVFGLYLELIDVVYTESETVLRLRIQGIPQGWSIFSNILGGYLEDDLGNVYTSISRDDMGFQQEEGVFVMTFEPLQPGVNRLSLSGVLVEVFLPIESQSIYVDFGSTPQVGDSFPIDQNIFVLGTSIHFTGVQIAQRGGGSEGSQLLNEFRFDIAPFPTQDGWTVSTLGFTPDMFDRLGSTAGGGGGGGGGSTEGGQREMSLSIGIPSSVSLPTGQFEFSFDTASIMLECPSITWEVVNGQ